MDEQDLESAYPDITWKEPLPIRTEEASGLGCRYCIALYGVHGRNISRLSQSRQEFDLHMKLFHNVGVPQ